MSRVAKNPIPLPSGVEVTIDSRNVTAKGPKGKLFMELHPSVNLEQGENILRIQLSEDGRSVVSTDVIYRGDYGRLRDVLVSPDGEVYIATSNEDGRGQPASDDDRILKITRRGVS